MQAEPQPQREGDQRDQRGEKGSKKGNRRSPGSKAGPGTEILGFGRGPAQLVLLPGSGATTETPGPARLWQLPQTPFVASPNPPAVNRPPHTLPHPTSIPLQVPSPQQGPILHPNPGTTPYNFNSGSRNHLHPPLSGFRRESDPINTPVSQLPAPTPKPGGFGGL